VHGASRDAIEYAARVVDIELTSVTDNPLVFEGGDIISGGNFHGQPIALAMDFLAIAVAEIGSISERRIEKITNPHQSGLPAFATRDSGLNSGFMIPHVVAAALVSENKVLSHPASVDSIPTSADKEDHVSMGPIAARKAREIVRNVRRILAIEFLAATQGLDLLAPLKPSAPLKAVLDEIRRMAPMMERDRSLAKEIEKVAVWIGADGAARAVSNAKIELQ
jgi:histidine ammonia-lyase